VKNTLSSAPSAVFVSSSASPAQVSSTSWQGYLAPSFVAGSGFGGTTAMTGLELAGGTAALIATMPATMPAVAATATKHVSVATAPFAAAMTLAAAAPVAAVADTYLVTTAPKQADKLVDTRNDVPPLGNRPGAPPS